MTSNVLFWFAVFYGLGLPLMLALSHPPDVREGRWRKILLSTPIILGIAWLMAYQADNHFSGFMTAASYGVGFMLLSVIWAENVGHFGGNAFHRLLHGSGRAGGGFVPEFGHARGLMKDRNWQAAIEEIEEQLRKDPHNLEGRRLLISNYLELQQPARALEQAGLILQSPHLTGEQRQWAAAAREQLRAMVQSGLDAEPPRR
jgi:hypothetical protein